jgi:hypothetical protein
MAMKGYYIDLISDGPRGVGLPARRSGVKE